MFTSRSGAARRAARTVVAERRSAAPPWRRAGARTRGPRSGRRAAGRGSRDRPGTVPQAGTGAGYLTGTRTREVTSQVEVRLQHTPRTPTAFPRIPLRAAVVHNRVGPSTARARGFRRPPSGGHREGMDGRRTAQTPRRGGRVGPRWTAAGMAAGMVWAAAVLIALDAGAPPHREQRPARRPCSSRPGCRPDGRRARTAGKRRKGVGRRVLLARGLAAGGGAAGRDAVPGADAPLRSGTPGVDLTAPVGAAVRAAAAGTVVFAGLLAGRGVVSVQHCGRAADHLRAGGPGRRGRDAGRAGRRARHARPRTPGLPGGVPALGGAPRTRELPGPAAADDAAARPAAAAARPVAGRLLSGPPPRGRRAAGRPAGRAAGRPATR